MRNASAELYHQDALVKETADISSRSSLSFLSSTGIANIYGIKNAGDVFLSGGDNQIPNLNHAHVAENYAGEEGSCYSLQRFWSRAPANLPLTLFMH